MAVALAVAVAVAGQDLERRSAVGAGPRAGRPEAGQVALERPRAQGVLGA